MIPACTIVTLDSIVCGALILLTVLSKRDLTAFATDPWQRPWINGRVYCLGFLGFIIVILGFEDFQYSIEDISHVDAIGQIEFFDIDFEDSPVVKAKFYNV